MSPEFQRWLDDIVARHKRAVFINYSTILARWESLWWWEKRKDT